MLDLRSPVSSKIEEIAKLVPGWTPVDELFALFTLVFTTRNLLGDVLEIGSWCGRSSAVLGLAAQLAGGTRIHCVDLFPSKSDWSQNADGSYSFRVKIKGKPFAGYQDQTVWKEPFERDIAPLYEKHDSILEIFNDTINRFGVAELITVFQGDSRVFAESSQDLKCRLAFLDGDHSYGAVSQDIHVVEKYLLPGGWICFDDAHSTYEGVDRAISEHIIGSGRYDLCQQMTRKFFVARRASSG